MTQIEDTVTLCQWIMVDWVQLVSKAIKLPINSATNVSQQARDALALITRMQASKILEKTDSTS